MYETYAKLRDERGYSDYRVSKETGINPSTLYCWKAGQYTPKAATMLKIARLFGVPLEVFYA